MSGLLTKKVIKQGSIVMIGHGAEQIIRLASNLIMTRLLVPEMFGIMTLAYTLVVGANLLSDVGLYGSVVKSKRGNDQEFLNTVWTIQVIRGFILFLVILIVGFILHILTEYKLLDSNNVYSDPSLVFVIAGLSLTALFNGFKSTKVFSLGRNLNNSKVIIASILSQITALFTMIVWASFDPSIWALVSGILVGSFIDLFLSHYFLVGKKNRFAWDRGAFREVFHFGKWIFLSSSFNFLANQSDKLILASLIGPKYFAYYAIAQLYIGSVRVFISKLSRRILLPSFGVSINSIDDVKFKQEQLKKIYYKARLPVDIFTLLLAGILFSIGQNIINVLYDSRYETTGIFLSILSLSLIEVRYSLANECFLILGKPKILFYLSLIKTASLFILLPIIYDAFDMTVTIWFIALNFLSSLPVMFYFKYKNNLLNCTKEFIALFFIVIGWLSGEAVKFYLFN